MNTIKAVQASIYIFLKPNRGMNSSFFIFFYSTLSIFFLKFSFMGFHVFFKK